ncbi:MAG: hypothetical protein IT442_13575 [Phycisphaeraceae bacterium]|nr:hypothetical protein [Phycisphaeraceae bacterium]
MAEDTNDTLRENASKPAEASVDGQTVKQHPLPDQIAADRYIESKKAARTKGLGVPLKRLSPPGAV